MLLTLQSSTNTPVFLGCFGVGARVRGVERSLGTTKCCLDYSCAHSHAKVTVRPCEWATQHCISYARNRILCLAPALQHHKLTTRLLPATCIIKIGGLKTEGRDVYDADPLLLGGMPATATASSSSLPLLPHGVCRTLQHVDSEHHDQHLRQTPYIQRDCRRICLCLHVYPCLCAPERL